MNDARGEIDKSQKEYFLREQLKAIKKKSWVKRMISLLRWKNTVRR